MSIAPTNNAGNGKVAGIRPQDKIGRQKKKKKILKRYKEYINEQETLTLADLKQVEKFADRLFAQFDIDVEFTKHFKDRVNDPRNKKPITVKELTDFFKNAFIKHSKKLSNQKDGFQGVFMQASSNLNLPFIISGKRGDIDLVAKTIMRKPNFKTPNKIFKL